MRIAVIGAGASGLCSALLLARYGFEVVLLEAGGSVAPLLRGFSRGGLQYDVGFHVAGALGPNGILRRYLDFAGILKHLTLLPQSEDCYRLFRFTGDSGTEDVCLPQGMRLFSRHLSDLWPQHAKGIEDFCGGMEKAFLHSPFMNPVGMAAKGLTGMQGGGCSEFLGRWAFPPRLKSLLSSCAVYYGVPPEKAVFEELALVTCAMSDGVHAVAGGGAALALAYEKALAEAGVTCRTGRAVSAIELDEDKAVKAVRMRDGETIACDGCIYTGHPGGLPAMLPEQAIRPVSARRLRALEESPFLFMAFGRTRSAFLHGKELFLCATDDIDQAFAGSGIGSTWMHIACGTADADGRYPLFMGLPIGQAPFGREAFSEQRRRPAGYREWKDSMARDLGAYICGHVPELSDLEIVETATEYSMRDWICGSTGSVYGALHSRDAFPVLPATRIRGLYLAGQSVILPGLLGTTISGALAAGYFIGFPRMFKDLACANAG